MIFGSTALAAQIFTPDSHLTLGEGLTVSLIGILVVMFELALLAIFILLMAKVFKIAAKFSKNKTAPEAVTAEAPVQAGTPLADGNSAGKIDLVNVDEPTAAVVMAIVSNQSGIPLNHLNFKSIKLLEENK